MWLDECGEHYMSTGLVRCAQVILANLALRKEIRVREAMKKASIDIQICTLLFYLSELWQYTSDHTHNNKLNAVQQPGGHMYRQPTLSTLQFTEGRA